MRVLPRRREATASMTTVGCMLQTHKTTDDRNQGAVCVMLLVAVITKRSRSDVLLDNAQAPDEIVFLIIMCTCGALYPSLRLVSPRFTMK